MLVLQPVRLEARAGKPSHVQLLCIHVMNACFSALGPSNTILDHTASRIRMEGLPFVDGVP